MDAAAATWCSSRIYNNSPSLPRNSIKHLPKLWGNHSGRLRFGQQYKIHKGLASGCVALGTGSLAELENQLEAQMKPEEKEEWLEMENLGGICKEKKGMVELLECLEKEAIMGEDEGKEPTDYNRRAQIFDRSSKVFQALKEKGIGSPSNQSS